MKKLIQIGSLLGLLVVFTAIGTSAQSSYGTEVNIPFAFNVGNKAYDAGDYIVNVSKHAAGASVLTIRDTKTDEIQQVLLTVNGEATGSDMKLMFTTIGDRKYLNRIITPVTSFSVVPSKAEKDARRGKTEAAASIGGGANLF